MLVLINYRSTLLLQTGTIRLERLPVIPRHEQEGPHREECGRWVECVSNNLKTKNVSWDGS